MKTDEQRALLARIGSEDEVRACGIAFRKAAEDGHIKGYPILFNALSEDVVSVPRLQRVTEG